MPKPTSASAHVEPDEEAVHDPAMTDDEVFDGPSEDADGGDRRDNDHAEDEDRCFAELQA